ncbi:MAG: excinuclease ABC subunit A [Nitrospira bacterium SG8_35_4]|nr:MAG: excinuclease ABC subunit A [Nitrospira bacterium SG8_35_4]
MLNSIIVKGARVHNLKNIDVTIPRDSFTVITGPSGSGKSSLAFDTIYAEGQRRYVESLSAYARQFLDQLQKPDVDSIEGLSPSIAIEQKTTAKTLRSTVGTITEIYDYLRVAYTRIGSLMCFKCKSPVASQNSQQILESVAALPKGTRIQVLSPIVMGRKGEYKKELYEAHRKGFIRARIDGDVVDITKEVKLNKHKRHNIDIVIDRLIIKRGVEKHISEAITHATDFADVVIINIIDENRDVFFSTKLACPKCGANYPEVSPRLFSFNSPFGACPKCRGLGLKNADEEDRDVENFSTCKSCSGLRLRKESLAITINGLNIGELSSKPIKDVIVFLNSLKLSKSEQLIASKILKETGERLHFLNQVGLGYLSLNRPAVTLSSGEEQRIKLATQIGSSLSGVLYIFDEPSIGLHPRDCGRLLDSLCTLREQGNSVLVVEHDEETMKRADHIIDMGPRAGVDGGSIVSQGSLEHITEDAGSLTGAYLRGQFTIPVPEKRRTPREFITVCGAQEFNLKNINVKVPLGVLTCVTGVSGSGKSTLVVEILYKALAKKIYSSKDRPGIHDSITGIEKIDKVIDVDQSPLGRTPRSNPATYTGIFTCESCRGDGLVKISMHFLPDVYVPCEECKGQRYNKETLDIQYKGKNISEVLNMTVAQALEFFGAVPSLRKRLSTLDRVGLGYMGLGQSATTLSGGEAQRVKLSRELGKKATGKTLYILDEPTTGLHFVDIQKLLDVLAALVDAGNSVVIIEHNLDIIKSADYLIDLGPESGDAGGEIVAVGTPEEVAAHPGSHTGRYLKQKLPGKGRAA